jgi:hypothetical protein
MGGRKYIQHLKMRWITILLVQGICISLGLALLVGSVFHYFFMLANWIYFTVFILSAFIFLYFRPLWKINETEVVRYLDNHFPQLEDSCALLLRSSDGLSVLESLQVSKIFPQLPKNQVIKGSGKKLAIGLGCLVVGISSLLAFYNIPARSLPISSPRQAKSSHQQQIENVLPQVANYTLTIIPPVYTSKVSRSQKQFYVKAEVGAKVKWNLKTNKSIGAFYVIFNDTEKLKLNAIKGDSTQWAFSRKIEKQGFYQLELDGVKSDLYPIDIIPDLPVSIKIIRPKSQTTIDIGQAQQIDLSAILTDDYGIAEAFISATMASGKGESVSFTEKKLHFNAIFNRQRNLTLNKHIDLKNLGMKPGDELYFFIHAKDNKGQQSRSDVYSVSIVDTAELMSMAGMTSGVNLVPEYFRSERQIILDAEKLLAEKDKLPIAAFKTRSNDLGVDQKLLRLRYGQFLGEENETQIGGDHDEHDHDGHEEPNQKFGDVQAIMDKYAHKHDIAEDATFFEPAIKTQLKAVLNEMWKAELNLRTYKPQDALPFAYKALRLLKDLQQKSRAYVAKTTVKTTALKAEKRLTGELDKITDPRQNLQFEVKDQVKDELRLLLTLLNNHQNGKPFSTNEKALLQTGEKQVIAAAVSHPESYLAALKSLRKLNVQTFPAAKDLNTVSRAIYTIIGKSAAKPQAGTTGSNQKLSNNYFNYLKKY